MRYDQHLWYVFASAVAVLLLAGAAIGWWWAVRALERWCAFPL